MSPTCFQKDTTIQKLDKNSKVWKWVHSSDISKKKKQKSIMPKPSKIKEVLFSEKQIAKRIKELADEINRYYDGKELVIIGYFSNGFFHFLPSTKTDYLKKEF